MAQISVNPKELKRLIKSHSKSQISQIINEIKKRCSSFQFFPNFEQMDHITLRGRLYEALMSIQSTPEFSICLEILTEESEDPNKFGINLNLEPIIKQIPFNPDEICKYLFKCLKESEEFKKKWQKRIYYGFFEFLSTNRISVSVELMEILFEKVLPKYSSELMESTTESIQSEDIDEIKLATIIKYNRSGLIEYERDLKGFFQNLTQDEIDQFLSSHLLYNSVESILREKDEIILYNFDQIPLLKRVLQAELAKFIFEEECSVEAINQITKLFQGIITKNREYTLTIEPWEGL